MAECLNCRGERAIPPPSRTRAAWLYLPWPGDCSPSSCLARAGPADLFPESSRSWLSSMRNLKCHTRKGHLHSDCDKYGGGKRRKKNKPKKEKQVYVKLALTFTPIRITAYIQKIVLSPGITEEKIFHTDLTIKVYSPSYLFKSNKFSFLYTI